MINVPYIDYRKMDKEFYTIGDVCHLFQISKRELKESCEQYQVEPRKNEIGEFGLVRYDVRKLHNKMYRAMKDGSGANGKDNDDPWA